ncbi:MAG: hypothetical protein RMI91_00735 [Gemmatales bacterium]|nr:hypothetical protein [Gemmatales bacterium]MDW7993158.1 hypothetical protein [Gemmatales bacterium]
MRHILAQLYSDDCGALLSFEWILLATILVLAMIVGLKSVQQAVLNEFEDVANAIGSINQTYHVGGAKGCCAEVDGSAFRDKESVYKVDTCTPVQHRPSRSCED